MNRRKLTRALGPKDLRQLDAAAHAAEKAGVPLTVMLTVHLGLLESARHDPGAYIRRGVVNRLGVWLRRRDIKLTAIWVRENFDGPAKEHLHLLAHIPNRQFSALQSAVGRWWPGSIGHLQRAYDARQAVRYLSKQMTPQARFATGFRVQRQTTCRTTGAAVAPVLGSRVGISRSLKALIETGTSPAVNHNSLTPEA